MKWIKDFKLFEAVVRPSKESDVESFLGSGSYDMIKERLIDFEHMGLKTSVSKSSSIIIDFEKNKPEYFQRAPYIKSHEVGKYDGGMTYNSLTIDAKSPHPILLNLDELESAYEDVSYFLESAYGLKPNYIYLLRLVREDRTGRTANVPVIQYVYFKNFSDIKEFMEAIQPTEKTNQIKTDGFTFGFYK